MIYWGCFHEIEDFFMTIPNGKVMFLGDKQVNFWFLHYGLSGVQGVFGIFYYIQLLETLSKAHISWET